MSKLNVNELEANSTNSNLKIVSKGSTGVAEVTGADNDATLQLNCSAQSHGVKLKAPADSAGQNYTIALPDNQIAANKLIKVKNITGSGTTAEGQLEFVDAPPTAYTNLDAANVTSGTFPSSSVSVGATYGGGLKLINKTTITTGNDVSSIAYTGLEDNGHYLIIGKDVKFTSVPYRIKYIFLGANGAQLQDAGSTTAVAYNSRRTLQNYHSGYTYGTTDPIYIHADNNTANVYWRAELFTGTDRVYFSFYGQYKDHTYPYYFINEANLEMPSAGTRVHGIQFSGIDSNLSTAVDFTDPTQILLYQYMDS